MSYAPSRNELCHYSVRPLATVRDVLAPRDHNKPGGLWLSVGREWLDWCQSERFHLSELRYVTPIKLRRGANVLRLRRASDLDAFTNTYRKTVYSGIEGIDWKRVMAKYDGIVIAPYQWSRRFDLSWYYGWDVASACVWRARAIAHVGVAHPVGDQTPPTPK